MARPKDRILPSHRVFFSKFTTSSPSFLYGSPPHWGFSPFLVLTNSLNLEVTTIPACVQFVPVVKIYTAVRRDGHDLLPILLQSTSGHHLLTDIS